MEICSAFFLCYVSGAGVACGRVHHAELLLSRPQFFSRHRRRSGLAAALKKMARVALRETASLDYILSAWWRIATKARERALLHQFFIMEDYQ